MSVYVIEVSSTFGATALRVVDDKYIEQRGWQKVKTQSDRLLLIDDHGNVEAMIIDGVDDPEAVKLVYDDTRRYH